MEIEFFAPYPYRPLGTELQTLLHGAGRVDAAVAFVTRPGIERFRDFVKSHGAGSARLVASVRFPTDLDELARLADEFPGAVWLHVGFKEPLERKADRGQFHSKVVLVEREQGERVIVVGSHNWTENALEGHNLEGGVIIRAQENEPIVAQVREHIEECARASEPFAANRLRFYKAVQRYLHRGPGAQESEDFPGFEAMEALVILAEDATPGGLPRPTQLFIPVDDRRLESIFAVGRRILLYLYPAGSLLKQSTPTASPVACYGSITMNNLVPDSPVGDRSATCQLGNLSAPSVTLLPANTVPPPSGERAQVVARFDEVEPADLRIFHVGDRAPKMQLSVKCVPVDRDAPKEPRQRLAPEQEETQLTHQGRGEPLYTAPHHLVVRAKFCIPSRDLYGDNLERILKYVLHGSDFFDESAEDVPVFAEPPEAKVVSRYVYLVNYRLSRETMARTEKQLKLFR